MTNKRFKDLYLTEGIEKLRDQFGYKNYHEIPKLQKVVLNMGVGEAVANSKAIESAMRDLSLISGQKPCVTKAKKSIAAFKLREGMKIGCKVTLRGDRMYEFLERLVYTALPRVKDFRGFFGKNFDGRGNLNFGIKEQTVFSEIKYDEANFINGMNISIVTTAKTNIESVSLLSIFKFPIQLDSK
jgi:large subunit ribosomal protein L5